MEQGDPVPGQVALVEAADGRGGAVTGIVARAQPLTLDVREGSIGDGVDVRITICGGGSRWLIRGTVAVVSPGRLAVDPVIARQRGERRSSPRRQVRLGLSVHESQAGSDAGPVAAHSVDVCPGGLRIETPHRLELGAHPMVIVSLPGGSTVMSRVEVLDRAPAPAGWSYRLAFRGLRVVDAGRLAAFAESEDGGRPGL